MATLNIARGSGNTLASSRGATQRRQGGATMRVAAERRAQLQAMLKGATQRATPLNLKAPNYDGFPEHRAWDLAPLS